MLRVLAFLSTVALLPWSGAAQAAWTPLSPGSPPAARDGMAASAGFSDLLIFGGDLSSALGSLFVDELWRFDGFSWSQLTPVSGQTPAARTGASMVYDFARGRYVLFGGRIVAYEYDDLWEWDGSTWQNYARAVKPSPRAWASMAYEGHTGRTILFGGFGRPSGGTSPIYQSGTWAWNGTDWTLLTPSAEPGPRAYGQLVYDNRRRRMIYFGGQNANGVLGETWSWDGQNWTQIPTATIPNGAGMFGHGMVYDTVRDRVVAFGGTTDGATRLGTVLEFDGQDWVQRTAVAPLQRMSMAMAHVLATGKTYLFGGSSPQPLNDTWEYQTNARARFTTTGAGCPTSLGNTPTIAAIELPWIGEDLVVEVSGVPNGAATFLMAGFLPVSISLAPIGAPACTVTADPFVIAGMPISASTGKPTMPLALPPAPSLIGKSVYLQSIVFEPVGSGHFSLTPRGDAVFGAL